jgi:radical SAM protein with 4Fe4S-binding SPASM domain
MSALQTTPRKASLLVTGRCNLACSHCTVASHGEHVEDMPLELWERVFDRLAEARVLSATVSGGEPFARSDCTALLGALSRRPLRIAVNTNATLVGRPEAEAIASLGSRLSVVMVSIDGATAQEHDLTRGAGAFDAMTRGVSSLRGAGIVPGFCLTVTARNAGSLEAVAELALELGRWLVMNPFVRSGPCLPGDLMLPSGAWRTACEEAMELSRRFPGRIRGSLPEMAAAAAEYTAGRAERRSGQGHSCAGASGIVTVLPDGRVTPCDHLTHVRLGSLLDTGMEEIFRSDAAKAFRDRIAQPLGETPSCSGCAYLDSCTGGCPAPSWDDPGPLGGDPQSCLRLYFGG